MPTCNAQKSTPTLRSNHWEKYDGEYAWRKVPDLAGSPYGSSDIFRIFPPPPQNQRYEGELFRDSMHGQGTYKWNELSVFEGGFYSNSKEGYAIVSFNNNCHFEGLFVRNKPFGPGIFTYSNGRQDAGFWMGRKLVRLSRAADYIVPRLAPTSAAKIKLLQFRRLIPLDDERDSAHDILQNCGFLWERTSTPYSSLIYDPRSIFFDRQAFEKTYFVRMTKLSQEFQSTPKTSEGEGEEREVEETEELKASVPPHCLCEQEVFEMQYATQDEVDVCEMGSSGGSQTGILYNLTKYGTMEKPLKGEAEGDVGKDETGETEREEEEEEEMEGAKAPKIVSWNRSEICMKMLKQIFRFRAFEDRLNFNLAKLMLGVRTAFRRTGVMEKECLYFLKMCSLGPAQVVKELLCNYEISEELMDGRGNNSMMFAAAADQLEVIDMLLDYGVDVNAFNDEGLTPLNLCLLRRLACANKISNWETAFLPKEIDQTMVPEGYSQAEPWGGRQSIPSLDRVFGDGMSMNDSKTMVPDQRFLSPITSPSLLRDLSGKSTARAMWGGHDDSMDSSTFSQITVLNILRSPRSVLNSSLEDVTPQSNRSQTLPSHSRPLASNEPTPKVELKLVPKSNKKEEFEKSVMQSTTDKYLFEFAFEKKPPVVMLGSKKREGSAKSVKGKGKKEESVVEVAEAPPDLELIQKIQTIDKTIEKLLKRGADPNVSEVPKPSVHLGVYTKDVATVRLLLAYGACPDTQLYPNEGLLAPLHVVVLLPPAAEFVLICELLLSFGANPETETLPEFSICEEEKAFLDGEQGRTPLQLLCMRPDVEYADPNDHLIRMALMLAAASDKRHFYKGHSCLTLSMHSANLKLLKALLRSPHFDPNALLGRDLGTPLHVLVSTEFQKKTLYDTSILICDLLLEAGADPTKELKGPGKLSGTCVDYGYREIDAEKEAKKVSAPGKKDAGKGGKEKGGLRDHLKDHVRVVEYLKEAIRRRKAGGSERGSKGNESAQKKKKSPEDGRRVTLSKGSERGGSEGGRSLTGSRSEESKRRRGDSEEVSDDGKSRRKTGREEEEREKSSEGNKSKKGKEQGEKRGGRKGGDKEGDGKKRGETGREKHKEKESKERGKEAFGRGAESKGKEAWPRRTESNLLKEKSKSSSKSLSVKACSETFPEKVRQNLLKMFGNCVNIDVNELLLPYVVLRDGELYYRFHGKGTGQKEQYSLI